MKENENENDDNFSDEENNNEDKNIINKNEENNNNKELENNPNNKNDITYTSLFKKDKTIKKDKSKNKFLNLFPLYKNIDPEILRYTTIVILILYNIATILEIIFYNVRFSNKSHISFYNNFQLLNFEFIKISDKIKSMTYFPFSTSEYAFYLFSIFILSFSIVTIFKLFLNEPEFIKSFFKDFDIYFLISLLSLIIRYLIGIISKFNQTIIYTNLIFSSISLLCILYVFLNTKTHKYKDIYYLVSHNFLPSSFLALETYCFLYCFCYDYCLSMASNDNNDYKYKTEIVFNIIFFFIGVMILTFKRDIIFPLVIVIFETGLLTRGNDGNFFVILCDVFILLFIFGSVILAIFQKKKKVFELEDDFLVNDSIE
jgi:hypothetical protein